MAGKEIKLYADESATINKFKAMIEGLEGIPPSEQHFFLNGVELENGRKFSDYNLQNGATATIHFIWRGFGSGT